MNTTTTRKEEFDKFVDAICDNQMDNNLIRGKDDPKNPQVRPIVIKLEPDPRSLFLGDKKHRLIGWIGLENNSVVVHLLRCNPKLYQNEEFYKQYETFMIELGNKIKYKMGLNKIYIYRCTGYYRDL